MVFISKFIDRTGEINYNKFGSKIIISEYRGALDIDVYFPSIIGYLSMLHIVVLKVEKSNVHMNLDIMVKDF